MATYKDVDALLKLNKGLLEHAEMNGMYNHARIYDRFVNSIEETPTADVVPREEVERLLEDFQGSIRADAKVGMSAGEILLHINNMLVELKKKYIGDKK